MPRKQKITYAAEYRGRPIMTDQARGLGCNEPILKTIHSQLTDMTSRHNKVLFMRYDVRFPADMPGPQDNKTVCAFHSDFIKELSRKGLDPHYVAVREQSREKHQHYHGVLLLDGNKTQNIEGHIVTAENVWRRKLNVPPGRGLIDACTTARDGQEQENGIMLRRDDPQYEEKIDRCFHWASYLAKERQKGSTPEGQRQLFASRTKKTGEK